MAIETEWQRALPLLRAAAQSLKNGGNYCVTVGETTTWKTPDEDKLYIRVENRLDDTEKSGDCLFEGAIPLMEWRKLMSES